MIRSILRFLLALVLCLLAVVGFFFMLGASGVAFLIAWPVVALCFAGAVSTLNK